jgi:hypothetical protein
MFTVNYFRKFWLSAGLLPLSMTAAHAQKPDTSFFENRIRPLFAEHCNTCHGSVKQQAGLRLDQKAAALKGADTGAVIVPGRPDESRLLAAVLYNGRVRMPPSGKLSEKEIDALRQWISSGAAWPDAVSPAKTGKPTQAKADFWSFQPIRRPADPTVRNRNWVRSPIDALLLSEMERRGIRPAAPADRRTLIRRVTFDLTGLPPTPEEIRAFLADRRPDAYPRLVDRLLASPAYGVRWARHWLDVVRYCDSLDARGVGSEGDVSEAWRYRDWVVQALNDDMPFDKFAMMQIAGDVLSPLNADARRTGAKLTVARAGNSFNRDGLIATTLLSIGNWGNGDADKDKILTDIADDQVDTLSRAFLGITMGCARCHDHKFDPFTSKDYYALAGIFFSTHTLPKLTPKGAGELILRVPLVSPAELKAREEIRNRIAAIETQLKAQQNAAYTQHAREMLPRTAEYLLAAREFTHRTSPGTTSLEEFAASRRLSATTLRRWLSFTGLTNERLMAVAIRDLNGLAGVNGWRSGGDTPSLVANNGPEARSIATFRLDPGTVAMHPSPTAGVALSWRAPVSTEVSLSGSLADLDPNCGDGFAWRVDRIRGTRLETLAQGEVDNGASAVFGSGRPGETAQNTLGRVAVSAGDRLQVVVLPRREYSCDTTRVEWQIASTDGSRRWRVPQDLVGLVSDGNPARDHLGNPAVWRFLDLAAVNTGPWQGRIAALREIFDDPNASAARLEEAAAAFQSVFNAVDSLSPFSPEGAGGEADLTPTARQQLAALRDELAELRRKLPAVNEFANGAQEGGVPESPHAGVHDVAVHIRGSYLRLGEVVPRGFPAVLGGAKHPRITQGSGRYELAHWIASPENPLTARVIANRVWMHHFGRGIVDTPSNFGFLGDRPSNPKLLDWLASELISKSWSLKALHREILLSSAYMQSSIPSPGSLKADPDNRLFSRMNRRRLEAEAVRDNILAVAGTLDQKMGGVAVRDPASVRRTLYQMTIRSDRTGFGPLFDMADSTNSVEKRTVSTVAPQALYLLNDNLTATQSAAFAKRLLAEKHADTAGRIQSAWWWAFGRPALPRELQVARQLLQSESAKGEEAAWTALAQVLMCANEFMFVD